MEAAADRHRLIDRPQMLGGYSEYSADRPAGRRCWVGEHAMLGPVGITLMLVYLLGYPLLTFFRVS